MLTQRYNTGGLIGGSILIGLGLLFLLAQFFNFAAWQFLWPFFVIGVGGLFFVGMLAGGKPASGLAIPGSLIGVIGLMLLYQNLTGHWSSWAYGWLDAGDLSLRLSGAGSIDASGTAAQLEARLSGFGSYQGGDLRAEMADITISGTGSAVVWVTRHLEANISGLGSVQYYGQPQVTQSVSGMGSVQRLGDK
jgi:hypothetical protein